MSAPTLTEFLRARIAHDAVSVRVFWSFSRRDAECEAKRRIVEMHPVIDGYCEGCGIETQSSEGCLNLRHLASAYADHPDYRDEWRP